MKRIMIIGCGGAGKSTLSRKIHDILGVQLIHLDQYYWNPNWVETEKEQWASIVENLVNKKNWVMDGNYGGTMDIRIARADTIIFLNYPTLICLFRVVKRVFQNWGKSRPDISQGCVEKFDFEFFHYILNYNKTRRGKILQKLTNLAPSKKIFILKKDKEVNEFLFSLNSQANNM